MDPLQDSNTNSQPQAPAGTPEDNTPHSAAAPQPQVAQPTVAPQSAVAVRDAGHGLGIASLITSLLGLIGIILGIMALVKSKKSGHSNPMAIIGIVWGAITGLFVVPLLAGLVLNNFQAAQRKERDSIRTSEIYALHFKLEEYYNDNTSYPLTMSATNFPGIDTSYLTDNNGKQISVYTSSKTETEALATAKPTESNEYQYIAYGCGSTGCKGYVLRSYIEKPTSSIPNPLVRKGLQNY